MVVRYKVRDTFGQCARRRFFSSLVQRAAKAHTRLKGGSLTMLLLLPGVPATGEPPPAEGVARNAAAGYRHLSEEQRAKLMAALQRQVRRFVEV